MKPALAALAFFMMLMSSACTSPQLPSPAAGPIVIQSDTDIASTPIATFVPTDTAAYLRPLVKLRWSIMARTLI